MRGALIVKGDKILLGKRKKKPFKGYWDILGGFLKLGEHPLKGLIREIKEESGLKVEPVKIVGIFMDKYGPKGNDMLNIHYLVRVTGGQLRAKSDVIELKWFSKEKLPRKIAFRNSREALRTWHNIQKQNKKEVRN